MDWARLSGPSSSGGDPLTAVYMKRDGTNGQVDFQFG